MDATQYQWIDRRLPEDFRDQLQWFGQHARDELPADLRKDYLNAKTPKEVRDILTKAVEGGQTMPYAKRVILEIERINEVSQESSSAMII